MRIEERIRYVRKYWCEEGMQGICEEGILWII